VETFPITKLKRTIPFLITPHDPNAKCRASAAGAIVVSATFLQFVQTSEDLAYAAAPEYARIIGDLFEDGFVHKKYGFHKKATVHDALTYYTNKTPLSLRDLGIRDLINTEIGYKSKLSTRNYRPWDADLLGFSFLLKAGYDLDIAIEFWRRMAAELKDSQRYGQFRRGGLPDEKRLIRMKDWRKSFMALQNGVLANSQVNFEEFGIARVGLAEDVAYWPRVKPKNENSTFGADVEQLVWYVEFLPKGVMRQKGGPMNAEYRVEWFQPNGDLYDVRKVATAFFNNIIAKSTLNFENILPERKLGKWRVRSWYHGFLLEDRFFHISKQAEAAT